jgi:hypothetical protein
VDFSQRMPPVQNIAIRLLWNLSRFCLPPRGEIAETLGPRIDRALETCRWPSRNRSACRSPPRPAPRSGRSSRRAPHRSRPARWGPSPARPSSRSPASAAPSSGRRASRRRCFPSTPDRRNPAAPGYAPEPHRSRPGPRDGPVDPLGASRSEPFTPSASQTLASGAAQRVGVGEPGEPVKRGDDQHGPRLQGCARSLKP